MRLIAINFCTALVIKYERGQNMVIIYNNLDLLMIILVITFRFISAITKTYLLM